MLCCCGDGLTVFDFLLVATEMTDGVFCYVSGVHTCMYIESICLSLVRPLSSILSLSRALPSQPLSHTHTHLLFCASYLHLSRVLPVHPLKYVSMSAVGLSLPVMLPSTRLCPLDFMFLWFTHVLGVWLLFVCMVFPRPLPSLDGVKVSGASSGYL